MLDSLGINIPSLVAFVIQFTVLLVLLTLVLYRPVTRMLDQRAAKIDESLQMAEKVKEESLRAEETVRAEIEAGRKEGMRLVSQAVETADRIKAEAREEARKEAEQAIAKARAEIARDREDSLNQLRSEFAELATRAAEKVIRQSLDGERHQRLIDQVLEEGLTSRKD